jgi:phosphatidylglycerophosphatase C
MPVLALFDFDGTLTRKDSFLEFLKFAVGKPAYYIGMFLLSPILALYLLKLIPNHTAKMLVIKYFMEGWHEEKLWTTGKNYSIEKIPDILHPEAMDKLKWHQEAGHHIVVVSASIDWWLKPWCEAHQLACICTEMRYEKGKFSGEYATPNCYGSEKERRIHAEIMRITQYTEIYAYGDSRGDTEMLKMATHPFYRKFN